MTGLAETLAQPVNEGLRVWQSASVLALSIRSAQKATSGPALARLRDSSLDTKTIVA
jgi:hypothetical protein